MRRRKQHDQEEIAATLRAAKLFAGESEAPMSPEEVASVKEIRDKLPRPDKADLADLARKIADQ